MSLLHNKKTILLILVAFAFSFAIRLIWVQQFSNTEEFKFHNQFMINTNDGYYYAEGTRDILSGVTQDNDLSPVEKATSQLTAFFAKILPFSLETILFYLPAFLSSLVVIPIILIAKKFEKLDVGIIAALLGSIAWSYYNRTMVGYYDTDMLNIVFPMLLLWSIIWAIDTKENKYLVFTAIDIFGYRWWYPQSYALEFAFWALLFAYLLYQIFQNRKSLQKHYENSGIAYTLQLLTIMMLAMIQLEILFRVMLVFGYFMLFTQKRWHKHLYIMLMMTVILFLSAGGFDIIWNKLRAYVFTDHISVAAEGLGLHFFTVMQTIREAGQIPFETFANRISGHTITFILSIIGYIWLASKHKVMLLGLPLLGLGFLALSGGLRFTIYAVPVLALGIGYLIVEVSKWLSSQLINDTASKVSKYILMFSFTAAILYPNIVHIVGYKVPTVFTKKEVIVLDKLKKIATREDYVISWWDYGYPLRFYSDVKTLGDGGKHSGSVNFPISYILSSPQEESSKMARLDVEYTEKRFATATNNKKFDKNDTQYVKIAGTNIEQMTVDYGYKDTNDFLDALKTDMLQDKLPLKTRDIYLYLPNRMMSIFPTVNLFSNIDLMTGKKGSRPFFYKSNTIKDSGNTIALGNGINIFKNKGQIQIGKKTFTINNFAVTQYNSKGILNKKIQTIDKNSPISVIYMKNYNQFLVLDKNSYNSTYIQLFVLENFDKNLYEKVILTPLVKVFKLKI